MEFNPHFDATGDCSLHGECHSPCESGYHICEALPRDSPTVYATCMHLDENDIVDKLVRSYVSNTRHQSAQFGQTYSIRKLASVLDTGEQIKRRQELERKHQGRQFGIMNSFMLRNGLPPHKISARGSSQLKGSAELFDGQRTSPLP
jgi:hypothetical protein